MYEEGGGEGGGRGSVGQSPPKAGTFLIMETEF